MKINSKICGFMSMVLLFTSLSFMSVYGKGNSGKIDGIATLWQEVTLFSDNHEITKSEIIKSKLEDIYYIKKAPELVFEIENPMSAGTVIDLQLENALWFFADEKIKSEDFADKAEKNYDTSYDLEKGTFIPAVNTTTKGVYQRKPISGEAAYTLSISADGKRAVLELNEQAIQGSRIVVPLVTKSTSFSELTVQIKSEDKTIINQSLMFAYYYLDKNETLIDPDPTTTYAETIVTHYKEFPFKKIVIRENLTKSLKNGSIELSAPEGFYFLPDINELTLEDLNKNIFDEDRVKETIIIQALDGIGFEKGSKGRIGIYKTNYDINYRYINDYLVDPSILRIDFYDIRQSENITGKLEIQGLKLMAKDAALDTIKDGEITVKVTNLRDTTVLTASEFVVGIMDASLAAYDPEKPVIPANLSYYTVEELIELPLFHQKPFITLNDQSQARPLDNATRLEIADMIYNLLGDTNIEPELTLAFEDISDQKAIAFCIEQGFINGYSDGTFRPNNAITRGELATILNQILQLNNDVSHIKLMPEEAGHWSSNALKQLKNLDIISGYEDGYIRPDNMVTRQEAILMINKAFQRGVGFDAKITDISDVHVEGWAYIYIMNALNGYTWK